jgi:hypothetical protein
MLRGWQYWSLVGASVLVALFVGANIALVQVNRGIQAEVNARQQYIQQTVQLQTLNQEIIRALVELAVRNNDQDVKALLGSNGITFTVNAPAVAPAPGPKPK